MRRAALIAVVGVLLAGCGGEETTAPLPETVEGGTTPTQTETGTTTTEPAAQGDPTAGKQVFAKNGCGSCHTFKPAGSSGTTGPDLDKLPEFAQKAGKPLDEFIRESVTNPNAYVEEGYPEGVMPPYDLSDKDLTDLVAFLSQA